MTALQFPILVSTYGTRMHWDSIPVMSNRRRVPQKGRLSCAGRDSPEGTERYASRRSILDGIRAERRIFTSRCLSMIVASLRDSSTSPIPSPIMSTLRPHPIATGKPSAIHSMRMTLSS